MLLFLMMLHPFSSWHQAPGEVLGASHIQVMSREKQQSWELPEHSLFQDQLPRDAEVIPFRQPRACE